MLVTLYRIITKHEAISMSWYLLKIVFIRGLVNIILHVTIHSSLPKIGIIFKKMHVTTTGIHFVNDFSCQKLIL